MSFKEHTLTAHTIQALQLVFSGMLSCCRIKRVQNSKALFTLIEGRIFTDCLLSQIFFDGFIR